MTMPGTPTQKRVYITGIGMVNPLGQRVGEISRALETGESGVEVTEVEGFETPLIAVAEGFQADAAVLRSKASKLFQRSDLMGATAALAAVENAGLDYASGVLDDAALFVSAGKEEVPADLLRAVLKDCLVDDRIDHRLVGEVGTRRVRPLTIFQLMPNTGMFGISAILGIRGPGHCYVSGAAAGAQAVSEATNAILDGSRKIALAGAADSRIDQLNIAALQGDGGLLVNGAEGLVPPFSLGRSGYALGEGAAYLVLEQGDAAKARGAEPVATVAGQASTFGHDHEAIAAAIQRSMEVAGVTPAEIDAVIPCGVGTVESDLIESLALRKVFGQRAEELPMTAIKPATGNMFGASAVTEIAVAAIAISTDNLPATVGFAAPDPECGLYGLSKESHTLQIARVLCLTLGFSGQCSSTIVASV